VVTAGSSRMRRSSRPPSAMEGGFAADRAERPGTSLLMA
jgi:hypothetical protein